MARYIEIYSSNRNRQQFPLTSYFEIPFCGNKNNNDPIINGAIYYKWTSQFQVDSGILEPGSTDSSPVLPPINGFTSESQPTEFNAYNGLNFFDFNNFTSRTIVGYDPTTATLILNRSGSNILPGDFYSIYDGSMSSIIHIPYEDENGNKINTEERHYDNYYIIDETLSYGSNIVSRKIVKYDNILRLAYLDTPFPSTWSINDSYTMRDTLPIEKWTLDVLTFINYDKSYGPIGPVITFPDGASNVKDYYKGKYVYFSSNNSIEKKQNFKAIYGNFYIKEYKVTDLGGGNYKRQAFVDYDLNQTNLPYFMVTSGTFISGTGNTTQILSNQSSSIDNFYKDYTIVDNTTGEERIIKSYNGNTKETTVNIPFTSTISGNSYTIITSNTINIVSFNHDNFSPLNYTGTIVSQNDSVCYEVSLVDLILPNVDLKTGSKIVFYPYVYVELSSVSSPNTYSKNIIYSNNPNSGRALFTAAITDVVLPEITNFIKPNCLMTQIVKFKPNDNFRFSVRLPNGKLFETIESDLLSPYEPNPSLQIHASFSIRRLDDSELYE